MFESLRRSKPSDSNTESVSSPEERDAAIAAYVAKRKAEQDAQEAVPKTKLEELAAAVDAKNRTNGHRRNYVNPNRRRVYNGDNSLLAPIGMAVATVALWSVNIAITNGSYGSERGQEYLEQQGYTNVESTGTHMFFVGFQGCGESDSVKYSFEATAPNGDSVDMMVCKGLFKAATIREG